MLLVSIVLFGGTCFDKTYQSLTNYLIANFLLYIFLTLSLENISML